MLGETELEQDGRAEGHFKNVVMVGLTEEVLFGRMLEGSRAEGCR